ncbi:hypothetical protein [Metabacillus fastidiosus]|uniref:Phage protein n=1 Tax=Metabacillus fastidiosus TaxID=1458 RepID=A0ABU6NRW8_9BACI|nr:hypothetical protein [Metabacillus fastidiosus]
MKIRSKKDIVSLLNEFETISHYDQLGNKHYIFFHDKERNGTCTVMKYKDGSFTIHSQGEGYCDTEEKPLLQHELLSFIWKHRKAFCEAIRP